MEEFAIFLWFAETRLAFQGFESTLSMQRKLGSITQIYQPLWTLCIYFIAEKSHWEKSLGENSAETVQENGETGPIISDRLTCDITIHKVSSSLTLFLLSVMDKSKFL